MLPSPELVDMDKIYLDNSFNCRGPIDIMSCLELAEEIKTNGLDSPIHIRRKPKDGKEYQIVAGHRRYTCFKINKEDKIPAVIRTDLDNEFDAIAMNLRENIHRKDISFIQEAKKVHELSLGGFSENQLRKLLGRGNAWLEPRMRLMELPKFVQDEAHDDRALKQSHIAQLYKYKDQPEKLVELVRKLKERVEDGAKGIRVDDQRTMHEITKNKQPSKADVREIRDIIYEKITRHLKSGNAYFPQLLLNWVIGEASMLDIYKEIEAEALEPFDIPYPKA